MHENETQIDDFRCADATIRDGAPRGGYSMRIRSALGGSDAWTLPRGRNDPFSRPFFARVRPLARHRPREPPGALEM